MKQKLSVLLGDAISSRRINEREKFQEKIEKTCEEINVTYGENIYAQFKILKGIDEVGGVLSTISNSYQIIVTFQEQLYPHLMRFGLALDYVDTALDTKDVAKMDGPAFHRASNIMDELKESKSMFGMSVGDDIIDIAITNQVNLIQLLRNNWSARQRQIIKEYEKLNNQYKVAEKLGTSQQNISAAIKRAMWKEIKNVEKDVNDILYKYAQRINKGSDPK